MKKSIFLAVVLLIVFISCTPKEQEAEVKVQVPDLAIYEHQQTKDVVKLVYDAVNEIEQSGTKAFEKFRQPGSKWFMQDIYVFVWGMDGMRYVYPPDPAGEGKNMKDLKDINGQPIGQEFIATAGNGEGWVFYMWNKPGATEPETKTTFIKKAVDNDGKEYLVGCGLYGMPREKVFEE